MRDKLVELLKQVREGTITHGGIASSLEGIVKQIDLESAAKKPAAQASPAAAEK